MALFEAALCFGRENIVRHNSAIIILKIIILNQLLLEETGAELTWEFSVDMQTALMPPS
jgi:hypothetical protein